VSASGSLPERTATAVAEPETQAENGGRRREPGGGMARFDQIVTPHPLVAFLFRRRTFLVLLGILSLAFWAQPRPDMLAVGICLAVVAECWRVWAAGTIHKTEEITTAGPYAYVRHPLYVGSFLHAVAYSFMSGRWEGFLVIIPLFLVLYSAAVSTEEAMLNKLFGDQYAEYSRRVPRFIPRLGRRESGNGRFSWAQAWANKEYVNIIWMIVLSGLFVWRLVSRA